MWVYRSSTGGCTGLVQVGVQVQYRWVYRSSTGGCTGPVQVGVQVQYRWVYRSSTGGCTGHVQMGVQILYRWVYRSSTCECTDPAKSRNHGSYMIPSHFYCSTMNLYYLCRILFFHLPRHATHVVL